MTGRIIYLNGTSSSGKSSIALSLQQMLEEPHLRLGVDTFLGMMPIRYLTLQHSDGIVPAQQPDDSVHFKIGAVANQTLTSMYYALAGLARAGSNVIFDDVIQSQELLRLAVTELDGIEVVFVGVHAPIEELERREVARGDRLLGLARGSLAAAHEHGIYDLEIDTRENIGHASAQAIVAYLRNDPHPSAFKQLRSRFANRLGI